MKAAKSCLDKGSDYAKNEVLRLERMLSKVHTPSAILFLLHRSLQIAKSKNSPIFTLICMQLGTLSRLNS